MSNYSLDTPTRRGIYVPGDSEVPFAPAYSPPNPPELDQTYRRMTWQFDKRQQIVGTQEPPKSARLEKKK